MFTGLNTALTSLYAQRQALETTGNNIANANTEGYTRQRVDMQAISQSLTPAFFSTSSKVGIGVSVNDISRVRDAFMEARSLQEHGTQGKLNRMQETMAAVELSFGEPSDNGLQSQMSDFWSSWDDVANNPSDAAARSQVIEQAQTLVAGFQQSANDLKKLSSSSLEVLKGNVKSLNAMAQNIADLNVAIRSATNANSAPNALLDQRDQLIRKMSDIANITVQTTEAGSVAVTLGGVPIVRDERVTALQVDDAGTPVQLRWDSDGDPTTTAEGYPATITGGDVGGLMESINATIPRYLTQLNAVATSLISTVNTQHASGLDKQGNPGGVFFTGTSASDVAVDATLAGNSSLLAAAKVGGGPKDAENARTMADLSSLQNGPDSIYRQMIDVLGVEAQRSNRQVDIQSGITNAVDGAREATAGVNLDEEMTNMVKFQKSYDAAAKYMGVMSEMLDTLMGIVR